MASQTDGARQALSGETGVEFAINKTRGLAFSRPDESGEWQPIDPKSVAINELERVSHTKIGDNWFSVYRAAKK